jgi:translocation and assembly module TamB
MGGSTGQTDIGGSFQIGLQGARSPRLEASGTVAAVDVKPDRATLTQVTRYRATGAGTPLEPIVKSLADAVMRLGEGVKGSARYTVTHEGSDGQLRLNTIRASSRSGAELLFSGVDPVRYAWRKSGLQIAGNVQLSGGGFPLSVVQIAQSGSRWSGAARIAPLASGDTRVVLSPIRFALGPDGANVEARATIDGRMGTTRFVGLQLPVSLHPGSSPFSGCQPLIFDKLDVAGISVGRSQFQTCIVGNEARFVAPRFAGHYGQWTFAVAANTARYNLVTQSALLDGISAKGRHGSMPFVVAARSARYDGGGRDFALQKIAFIMGSGGSRSSLSLGSLTGSLLSGGARGRFGDASGQIASVPLNMTRGNGDWREVNGGLSLNGQVNVADQQAEARFQPLVSRNFVLRFADNSFTGRGGLTEPLTGAQVANVDITHSLSTGTGRAILDVPQITFDKTLQPEQLTRITLGVIANVEGSVGGRGEIRWGPKGVRSDGRFSTSGLNLAAAFGPVRQLKGDIVFTDLLGMETAPGQSVEIAEINSGIQVTDGRVKYRLLPGLKVEVEGGRWPFSGGELILEPTVLDLSESAERRLTFRVVALDAAKFINALQFENIAATGTFDGVIPMIFDKNGGRIEAGNLIVRDAGGTLSYVGEVSQENLGTYGSIAFDALKSIKYKRLSIDLGGPLDAEMVTQIRFNGVNQSPIIPGRAKLPIPIKIVGLTGIPFIFNITIKAPFRGLVTMARSFQDPSGLIQDQLDRERERQDKEKRATEGSAAPDK